MFDTSKLKGRIVEKFGSQTSFCTASHRSDGFVSKYLNGKCLLDQKTINEWVALLEINPEDIQLYFFTPKVHETEQPTITPNN